MATIANEIDYDELVAKTASLMTTGLTGLATVITEESEEDSYPVVLVGEPEGRTAEDMGIGGDTPQEMIYVPLTVITFQGFDLSKTYAQIKTQARDIMQKIKKIIRENKTWGGFAGCRAAHVQPHAIPTGTAAPEPGFHKLATGVLLDIEAFGT